MNEDRTARVWSSIREHARRDRARVAHRHVSLAAADALGGGVALSLTTRAGAMPESIAATDPVSEQLEERQSTIGEGPGLDAVSGQSPLLVPDLTTPESVQRWPIFTEAASAAGVRAMFAFPVRAGLAPLGVLDLYRFHPGELTDDELADALSYADAALALALDLYGALEPGSVEDMFSFRRAAIHQASGMVSVQLGISVAEALARLRAYAFAHDQHLADVAADVVERRLHFGGDDPG